jgi:hypothetical protein
MKVPISDARLLFMLARGFQQARKLCLGVIYCLHHDISCVAKESDKICVVPTAFRHSGRKAADKLQLLQLLWIREHRRNQSMIPIQNGERPILV